MCKRSYKLSSMSTKPVIKSGPKQDALTNMLMTTFGWEQQKQK